MSIDSRLSDAVKSFLKDKSVVIEDDKKSRFESAVNSIESEFNRDLNSAFGNVREHLSKIAKEDGFDMNYEYADRILKKIRISL